MAREAAALRGAGRALKAMNNKASRPA